MEKTGRYNKAVRVSILADAHRVEVCPTDEGEIYGVGFSWQSVCDLNSVMAKLAPGHVESPVQAVLITTGSPAESWRSAYAVMCFFGFITEQDQGPVQ